MTMIADRLSLLRCPETGLTLTLAAADLVRELNEQIAERQLVNRGGQMVEKPLDGGLVREGGDVVYPIVDDIPVLLKNEAIEIAVGN
jgi:uncharacterized protein YbaR (Trm112 family)